MHIYIEVHARTQSTSTVDPYYVSVYRTTQHTQDLQRDFSEQKTKVLCTLRTYTYATGTFHYTYRVTVNIQNNNNNK